MNACCSSHLGTTLASSPPCGCSTTGEPIAEINRRVGAVVAELGLPKPSYVHLRRLIHDERERRDYEARRRAELRQVAVDVTTRLVSGRFVDPYVVAGQLRNAGEK